MEDLQYQVGVAKIDITPNYPIRLSGYGARREETSEISQRIYAKSLVISHQDDDPFVLILVENVGIPNHLTKEISNRLGRVAGVSEERFVICSTHTHSAPCLSGMLPTLFGQPIPSDHQQRIEQYTVELVNQLEDVAKSAIDCRIPAHLAWTIGNVGFGKNRRPEGGPVDHSLPVLLARNKNGNPIAIWASYACHTTTLSLNCINGDWAGYAMEQIEATYSSATAYISLGCAADINPHPRGEFEHARQHGHTLANEINRSVESGMKPITGKLSGTVKRISLPFDTIPSRKEWEKRAKQDGALGYHAKVQLKKLDSGEKLQTAISYPIQTWAFSEELLIVFLAGEVVVDFAHRLKDELDHNRLWINAYSNDLPCYIPSVRILNEGGYEGKDAMIYFDRPTHFKPEVEELIISEVHKLTPKGYLPS